MFCVRSNILYTIVQYNYCENDYNCDLLKYYMNFFLFTTYFLLISLGVINKVSASSLSKKVSAFKWHATR